MVSKLATLGAGASIAVAFAVGGSPVASASVPAHYPIGTLVSVRASGVAGPSVPTGWHSGSYVNAVGWSFDPDAKATSEIVRSYDGSTMKWRDYTKVYRADVNSAYRLTGSHGYSPRYPLTNGMHRICTYQENMGAGASDWSNCGWVAINGSPYGALETLSWASPTSVRFSGWAADPDDTRVSTSVTYTVDGGPATTVVASTARPDVNSNVKIPGNHGFTMTVNVPSAPASHTVCVSAVNYGPGAPATKLGCRTTASTTWAWGWNYAGQLGDGNLTDTTTPVKVHIPNGALSVASNSQTGYALEPGGTVWAWGYGAHPGCACYEPNPMQVAGLSRIVQITGGGLGTFALRSDGTVWGWGTADASPGGTLDPPAQIGGLSSITMVAGGESNGYALRSDGTVWAWGGNDDGQLGNGTPSHSPCQCSVPSRVVGLTGVSAIASQGAAAYALKSDGTVWAWGHNDQDQLGNSSVPASACSCSATPVQVSGLASVSHIAAGEDNGYALLSDGTVWGWGMSGCNMPSGPTAGPVYGLSGITQVAASGPNLYALRSDGTEWAVGGNSYGELGNGSPPHGCDGTGGTPVQVAGISHIHQIAAGGASAYAITTP